MKNLFVFLVSLFILGSQCVYSQDVNLEQMKKEARKSSKRMAKEGWRNAPGAPSIYQQLLDEKHYQTYEDDKGNLLYLYTIADHEADSYVEAYEMALLIGKLMIVGSTSQIFSNIDISKDYRESKYISKGNCKSSLDHSGFDTIYCSKEDVGSSIVLQKNNVYVKIDEILDPKEHVYSETWMELTPQLDRIFHVVANMYQEQKNGKIYAVVSLAASWKDLEEQCGQNK